MTTSQIDIKVGLLGDENPELYEQFAISFQFHKDKLQKLNQTLAELSGSTHAPLLLIELPVIDFKQIPFTAKDSIYEFKQLIKDNKLYHVGNLKSPEHQKFVKTLNKTFSKLTELDNWAKFNLSFYDSTNIKKKDDLWNKALIKGEAKIDNQFIGLFHELVKKVSPEFADSPLVILLELLQSVDLNLNLKRFSLPEPEFRDLVKKFISMDTSTESRILKKLKETREEMKITITVGHLFSAKIKGPARAMGAFLAFL